MKLFLYVFGIIGSFLEVTLLALVLDPAASHGQGSIEVEVSSIGWVCLTGILEVWRHPMTLGCVKLT